jgi:hypothetical protein
MRLIRPIYYIILKWTCQAKTRLFKRVLSAFFLLFSIALSNSGYITLDRRLKALFEKLYGIYGQFMIGFSTHGSRQNGGASARGARRYPRVRHDASRV